MAYFDLDRIKKIPLPEVLSRYGIAVDNHHFFKLREEKTPSARYYPETNSWYDFGANTGGTIIDLVKQLEHLDTTQAIHRIAEQYGMMPNSHIPVKNISNHEYNMIGIQGDRAGKNYNFDTLFSRYPMEVVLRISRELSVSMNQLFDKYPKTYMDIIRTQAIPFVWQFRQVYLNSIYVYAQLNNSSKFDREYMKMNAEMIYKDYQDRYGILKRCVKGTDIDIRNLRSDFERDLKHIQNGKIAVEISPYSQMEFKELKGANVSYIISIQTYRTFESEYLSRYDIGEYPYLASAKGDIVTMTIKETDRKVFECLLKQMEKQEKKEQDSQIENPDYEPD